MGVASGVLVFFIYQITKTLSSPIDFPSAPPLPLAEHQIAHLSVIDPGIGQPSLCLTNTLSLDLKPYGSVPLNFHDSPPTPRSEIDRDLLLAALPTSGYDTNNLPTALPFMMYPETLEALAPFGSLSFHDSLTSIPTFISENVPTILPGTKYPTELPLEPLKLSPDYLSSFCDVPSLPVLPTFSSNSPSILPFMMNPSEASRELFQMPLIENNPLVASGLKLSGVNGLITENNPILSTSDLQLGGVNMPIPNHSPLASYLGLQLEGVNVIDDRINAPIIHNNPIMGSDNNLIESHPSLQLAGLNLPLMDHSSSISPLALQLAQVNGPILENNPILNHSGLPLGGVNMPIAGHSPLASYLGLQLEGTVPIIDYNPTVSPSVLQLAGINVPIIYNNPIGNPSGLQLGGVDTPITNHNPLASYLDLQLEGVNVPITDKTSTISPNDLQLAGMNVPIFDHNLLVSSSDLQLSGGNVPIIDNNPIVGAPSVQLARVNIMDRSSSVSPLGLQFPGLNVPTVETTPRILASIPITDPLLYMVPYVTEVPQIGSNDNIPSLILDINSQIDQVNIPPNSQKYFQTIQNSYNLINTLENSITTNNLPPPSPLNYPFLEQLHPINQDIFQPKIDTNPNNFITEPVKTPFSVTSNISPDIIFKKAIDTTDFTDTLSFISPLRPTDVLQLVNTAANPIPKQEIPLLTNPFNEYLIDNIPPMAPQNPSASLSKLQSLGIVPSDRPIRPKVNLELNDNLKPLSNPVVCSEEIYVNTAPRVSTILENVVDIPKTHYTVDFSSNILPKSLQFPPELTSNPLPFTAMSSRIQSPLNLDVLSTLPNFVASDFEFGPIRGDSSNLNPVNLLEQRVYDPPITVSSPNSYTSQNILGTAHNLDSFVNNIPFYPEILRDSITDNILTDSYKPTRNIPDTGPESKIEPVHITLPDPIITTNISPTLMSFENILPNPNSYTVLTEETQNSLFSPFIPTSDSKIEPVHIKLPDPIITTNISPTPLSFESILPNPNSYIVSKEETPNFLFSPFIPILSSDSSMSSISPLNTNILDFAIETSLMPSLSKPFASLNSFPPFILSAPFIKSPSSLPQPSVSSLSTKLSNIALPSLLPLSQSNSSPIIVVPKTKSIPYITSITINIIPYEEDAESEIIIIL